ncbi:MAG: ABC transporter permease [Bacillota bacterium]
MQKRILTAIPVLIGVSLLVFLMLHALPVDPVKLMLTDHASGTAPTAAGTMTDEMYENMRHQLGLDRPLHIQFGSFLYDAIRGDLGRSYRNDKAVSRMIADNIGHTAELAFAAMGLAIVVGVSLGIFAAVNRGTWRDAVIMAVSVLGVSMPTFWFGLVLILVFALGLGWFPAMGAGGIRALVLPTLAMGLPTSAIIARLTRSSLVEVMRQDYMTTARAKGLREMVVVTKHGLKNALIPVVTIIGLQFGALLGGSLIIETVFGRPGLGYIAVNAIWNKDFPTVQGMVLFMATVYVFINIIVDISYAWFDPRVRYDGGSK